MDGLLKSGTILTSESGNKYVVKKLLGAGGQGEVYDVENGGKHYALKWYYKKTATTMQKNILDNLIAKGKPDNSFLWPEDLIYKSAGESFGYIMQLRPSNFKSIVDLMKRKAEPSFYTLCKAALINQRDYLQLSLVVAEHSRDISAIKSSLNTIDNEVADVVDRLGNVVTKSELSGFMNIFGEPEFRNEYVLWDGQPFESDLAYSAIYGKAEKTLYVIDNYIGVKTLALLKNSKESVEIILFSDNVGRGLHSTEFNDFCKQYPDCKIELKQTGKKYHDRYIVIDYGTEQEKIFHCGPSSKDGGMRIGSIVEIREREAYHTLVDELLKMPELHLA